MYFVIHKYPVLIYIEKDLTMNHLLMCVCVCIYNACMYPELLISFYMWLCKCLMMSHYVNKHNSTLLWDSMKQCLGVQDLGSDVFCHHIPILSSCFVEYIAFQVKL